MSVFERDELATNRIISTSVSETSREQVTIREYTLEEYSEMSASSYTNGIAGEKTRTSSVSSSNNPGFNLRSSKYIAKDEKHWVEIQKNTFTNWVNEQLREYGEEVTDLETAFEDGLKLIHLVESVSTKKVGRYNKRPRMYAQKLENVTAALKVVAEDGIHLVNIGNDDIVNGNVKLILGLLWRLILHYQISSGGSTSGKQLLLIWLRNALPDLEIKNLTSDWNNGIALSGLLEFCRPGLKPDYKRLNPDEALSNVNSAMNLAEQRLRIPKILSPEFFVNPYVDELSMMTYLSQFTKPGSPGETKTMEIVNDALSERQKVSNFNEDWIDGKALCHYVESQAPGTIPEIDRISELSAHERARVALDNSEEKLGIKKIITPEEVVDTVDELPLMAYVLQFRNAPSLQSQAHMFNAEGNGLRRATEGKMTDFHVHGRRDVGFDSLRVDVLGPSPDKRVNVEKRLMGDGSMRYMYTPVESGTHTVSIKHVGKHIPNSPFTVQVNEDVGDITVSGSGVKYANIMRPADFLVDPHGPSSAPITAIAEGPTRTVPVAMEKQSDGSYKASFVPTEMGEHKITVMVGSRPLPGCPFICKVGDPSKVVFTPHDGARFPAPGKDAQFTVDTSEAGLGELAIKCTGPDGNIPVNVRTGTKGRYDMSFTPQQTGDYTANFTFNGESIPSSPYTVFVSDPSKIVAHGKGLYQVCTRDTSEFFIILKGAGQGDLEVRGEGPHGRFPVEIKQSPTEPDVYVASYTLFDAGDYKIHVGYAGKPVRGSPFLVKVADPSKVRVDSTNPNFLGKKFAVRREVEVPVQVPPTAGEGKLEASVTGPDLETVPANVIKGTGDEHFIRFVPRKQGAYKIDVTYGGKDVQNSPFRLRATDPTSVRVKLQELESTSQGFFVKKQLDIPIDVPDEATDISCAVKGPDGERVESRLSREGDNLYHVKFTPYRTGQYTVDVRSFDESVENSPFVITVTEPAVQINLKEFEKQASVKYRVRHELDVPMEIPKEVEEVTATVTDPDQRSVSSTFRPEADGLHHLRFTPHKPGSYTVDIRSRGKSVEGSPFTMSVVDPASTLVRMREPDQATEARYLVRRELDIALDSPDDNFELSCSVKGPDDEVVQSSMVKEEDGLHHVKFVPYRPGLYKVYVRCSGEPVENSPFLIRVGDPDNKIRVAHVQNEAAQAEKVIKSEVDLALETPFQIDERDVSATVLGPGDEKVASQLDKDREGKYHVKFLPNKPGQYKIYVRYGGELVEGAPYIVNVNDKTAPLPVHMRCLVKLDEHEAGSYFTRHELDFPVEVPEGSNGGITAQVTGPDNKPVEDQVTRDRDGSTYHIRFVPHMPGKYRMDVLYANTPVKDSPFYIIVRDQIPGAKRCEAKGRGLTGGIVNERCEFKVDTHRTGPGRIQAWLSGVKYNANVEIAHVSNDTYVCHYITPVAGAYVLTVRYDGVDIPGSPYKVTIQAPGDASRCMVEGAALREGAGVFVGQPMGFSISSRDAGPGQLHVRCEGPSRDCDVTVFDNKDGTYHVQINPVEVGNHLVYVEWGGRSVQGSPFLVRVGQPPDPSKVSADGPGLDNGLLNTFKGNFLVDTRGAGPGTLKVRIHGPRGAFKVEMYRDTTKDRSIGVRYNPTEIGRYIINIKWADQHIPGSPFDVTVVETKEELDSLNELKDNVVGQQNGIH